MVLNLLNLKNQDFEADTKVFVIEFDNISSPKDLVHYLIEINMRKLPYFNEQNLSKSAKRILNL
mgnify:CR=1 FL=1|jgi:hypothetical protein